MYKNLAPLFLAFFLLFSPLAAHYYYDNWSGYYDRYGPYYGESDFGIGVGFYGSPFYGSDNYYYNPGYYPGSNYYYYSDPYYNPGFGLYFNLGF